GRLRAEEVRIPRWRALPWPSEHAGAHATSRGPSPDAERGRDPHSIEKDGPTAMMSFLPENIATYGKEIDNLFYLIYYITGAAFVLVSVMLLSFLVLYRARPGHRAVYSHGNTTLEMVWTIVPALILIVITFLSIPNWSKCKIRIPEADLHIRITGKQFNWEVQYPGPDGKFDTADDQTFDNELHVPTGKAVVLHLRARDVIHSVFIPNARFKQD